MAEALQDFELSAAYFNPRLLILGGVLIGVAGLCVWLGGLRWAGVVAAVIGGLTGLISAYAFAKQAIAALIIAPVVGGTLATFLKKPVLVLACAGGAAAATWMVFAASGLRTETLHGPAHPTAGGSTSLGIAETAVELKEEMLFWGETFLLAIRRMSPAGWAGGGAAAAAMIIAAFVFPRLITAVACAGIGVGCVFAGMVLVLLQKGSRPLTCIYNRGAFFALVVLIMVGFGTIVQLLLCPAQRHGPHEQAEHKGGKKK